MLARCIQNTEIKKGKLRGVVSEGMFCSVAEFGISSDLVLPCQPPALGTIVLRTS